jgi:molybdopterin-guanine dinucleotide biosynthesis protein A
MGQDKALIPVGSVPLLLRICRVAQQCVERVYVIAPWAERYQPLFVTEPSVIEPSAAEQSVTLIQEIPSAAAAHGPLIGFYQSLAHVQSDWILLLACDLPNLRAEVLQQWIAALPKDKETIACLPRNPEGWWEPLCGFYRSTCRASLTAFVQAGGDSFQQWLRNQPVLELPVIDPQMLLNCNTPEALRQIQPDY